MIIYYFSGTRLKQITLLMLVLFTIGFSAQSSDTSYVSKERQSISSDEVALIALDKEWINAEVNHDKMALERILDERFLATFASGKTVDRTAFIEMIMKMTISPFEVIHDTIQIHDDTALVIDLSSDRRSKYTWIALRRNGQWKVISETFTSVASPDK